MEPEIEPDFEPNNGMNISDESELSNQSVTLFKKQKLSLRSKATALAIALGIVPVVVIGAVNYFLTAQKITKDVIVNQEAFAITVGEQVSHFMFERYGDIQLLSNLHAFAHPVERKTMPLQEKEETLNQFIEINKAYDSIIVFDLKGNAIAQSKSAAKPFKGNYSNQKHYQEAIRTQNIVINKPSISESTGKVSVEIAAPIKELGTGTLIGVVRTRIPVENLNEILDTEQTEIAAVATSISTTKYHLIDADGDIFLAEAKSQPDENARSAIPVFAQLEAAKKVASAEGFAQSDLNKQLITYAPVQTLEGMPKLNWSVLLHQDTVSAFTEQRRLLLILMIGTGAAALLVGAIAAYLVNRATRPILAAADAVEKLGQGELDTRVAIAGEDELGMLGANINQMAVQLQTLVQSQAAQTQQAKFLSEVASDRDYEAEELESVFDKAVQGARELLNAERVVVYRFNPDWSGYIAAESVLSGWPYALNDKIEDACISEELIEAYRKGRVVPTNDVMTAGFHPAHMQLMERLKIKSNLVTPILKNDQLFGLLIAHHCAAIHTWEQTEVNFLTQLAALLGIILNRLSFLDQKQAASEYASQIKDITLKLTQGIEAQEIIDMAVSEIRRALKSDRVVIYSFNDKWQGTVVAESVAAGWPKALGAEIDDPCFADRYVDKYRQGRVQATENIRNAGLTDCHIAQLEKFAVKANLVAPIICSNQLLGLLIAHQCDAPRQWQQEEINLFSQIASQVGLALDRAHLLEQQKNAREFLQRRALELLMEVDPISKGDLTIRASVTEDEIGTIADSYNATINSLRKIVTQVQSAAGQVALTTTSSEGAVQELSQEALRQAEEIAAALEQIQAMSSSIRAVAQSATKAKAAVEEASQTVASGDVAMNRTVGGMLAIRETVAETSKKVKRLGESSQKISRVVNLIGTFADQTNLLALNASIEAAHAGEQGRGFAVVADEVRTLARQSAEATAEIESLVKDIQTETNEVVAAMESGTEQVVMGTKLLDETRQSLNKIAGVSQQISQLVAAIAEAAVTQTQASKSVTDTMTNVAEIANQTSQEATVVSASFKELLALAQELQTSASQFKVS